MTDPLFWLVFGIIAVPFSLLGLLFVAAGVYSFIQRLYLIVLGERAVGIVVALVGDKQSQQPDAEVMNLAQTNPYLRIAFTDDAGQSRKVTSDMGVSPKKFRIGDEVPLFYRRGHPKTFVVNRFWMKWFPPMFSIGLGLIFAIPALVIIANVWPAVGAWMFTAFRIAAPVLVPVGCIGGPILFAMLGAWLTRVRRRRLRQDYRTQGTILATGWNRRLESRWIRVAYLDVADQEQTRTLPVISGMLSRDRREGQTVDLLVDRSSPQDVLLNEPGELWFLPLMFLGIGSICTIAFATAWWWGELPFSRG